MVFRKDTSDVSCGGRDDQDCSMNNSNIVVIQSREEYHWYVHLKQYSIPDNVQVGQYVEKGQMIGMEGKTGWANAPHLHFMVQTSGWECCFFEDTIQYVPLWPGRTSPPLAPVDFVGFDWDIFPVDGWLEIQSNNVHVVRREAIFRARFADPVTGDWPYMFEASDEWADNAGQPNRVRSFMIDGLNYYSFGEWPQVWVRLKPGQHRIAYWYEWKGEGEPVVDVIPWPEAQRSCGGDMDNP